MSYEIQKNRIDAQPIAYVSGAGTAEQIPGVLAKCFGQVVEQMNAQGGKAAGPPFTRYLSMGETFEFQAGIPLQAPIEGNDTVEIGELPGGEVLVTIHMGPYDNLTNAYKALMQYVEQHGLSAGDSLWEYYWTDPEEHPDPAEWKTEIVLPLR